MSDSSTQSPTSDAAQPGLRTVVKFLCGNGMLCGRWFFDGPPAGEKDRYWWRKHLRAAFAAATQPEAQAAAPAAAAGWRPGMPITEAMHVAAVKVLYRAAGVDGLPQRMLDAMLASGAEPACKACGDTGMAVRSYDGGSITHVFDCDQCSRATEAPVAQAMESVLIDGEAYETPAPVAAELLRLHLELRAASATLPMRSPECWCETCDLAANAGFRSRMSLCATCGNKRCPRATHHDCACTGSNAPGEKGSSWERAKPARSEVITSRSPKEGTQHER